MDLHRINQIFIVSASMVFLGFASPANAGFEWVSPRSAPTLPKEAPPAQNTIQNRVQNPTPKATPSYEDEALLPLEELLPADTVQPEAVIVQEELSSAPVSLIPETPAAVQPPPPQPVLKVKTLAQEQTASKPSDNVIWNTERRATEAQRPQPTPVAPRVPVTPLSPITELQAQPLPTPATEPEYAQAAKPYDPRTRLVVPTDAPAFDTDRAIESFKSPEPAPVASVAEEAQSLAVAPPPPEPKVKTFFIDPNPKPTAPSPIAQESLPAIKDMRVQQEQQPKTVAAPASKTPITILPPQSPPPAVSVQNVTTTHAAPRPVVPQKTPEKTYDEIIGFGSDMPLALALRQVAPAAYSFSFDEGVNPGLRVSWNGGKPWNEVISDMVAPLELQSYITGQTIHITKAGSIQTPKRTNITDPGTLAPLL